ncbi:MAG TPA: TetR/AcrR family transcriptional regulator [Solirubrobacterales bacterium]|nr:TetR/AcrR family transcriptional regulator [Solirubrobacterales bacterium]
MVMTPWGDSAKLRERRLRPGPGVPREEVVANQRERLFGAMVAAVAERGYRATTVADLVELSGVSSRTFYDLFGDLDSCFLATLEAIIAASIAYAVQSSGERPPSSAPSGVRLPAAPVAAATWEERARAGFDAFTQMVASQPAAARLGLVEVHAAGPEARVPLEHAVAGFEWLARQMLEQSPERAGMPAEMVSAHVGAQQEIARARLRTGREAELPRLAGELWDVVASYRPPPRRLRLTGRPPEPAPETIDAHDHAERAIRALTAVVAEEGYAAATVDEVLRRGQMSASTFYGYFEGKDDAMSAAVDSGVARLLAAVLPAARRVEGWPRGIRAALGAYCNFLAARPALARLLAIEVHAAGPEAVERRDAALAPLRALIDAGREATGADPPGITAEVIVGGILALTERRLRSGGTEALPGLAPLAAYLALSPFLGAEDAARVANWDGRRERRRGA